VRDARQRPKSNQEAWQGQAAHFALLSEVAILLARAPDLKRLHSRAINKVKRVMDFQRHTLALFEHEGATYQLQTLLETRRDFPKATLESSSMEKGIAETVLHAGRMRSFANLDSAEDKPPVSDAALEEGTVCSALTRPLAAYNELFRAAAFGSTPDGAFSKVDIKLAQSFAALLSLAIDRFRQSEELQARNRGPSEALQQQTAKS
jgi:transcriptional regulator with GAF, ATPase, and Fis domain